jgi:thiol peroxidase
VGRTQKTGKQAPDFVVISNDMAEVRLSSFTEKVKVMTSFPSLDTAVCDLQVKEFNKRATGLHSEVVVLGISMDLPFAQKRFCQANDIKGVTVLSDYRFASFAINYGLLVKELRLLARAVLIVDKTNVLRHMKIVEEITNQPDYEDALASLDQVLKEPVFSVDEELPMHCTPCEEGTPPLPQEEVKKLIAQHRGWDLVEDRKLVREFRFKDFVEAKYFLDLISVVAEEQGHHPTMTLIYNKLKVTLTTHASGGLTENDFIMARIIAEMAEE